MNINRRKFLTLAAWTAAMPSSRKANADNALATSQDTIGVLVDTTLCVGCRKCEQACAQTHKLPDNDFENMTVLDRFRRPDESTYTVINQFRPESGADADPVYIKYQCMHCMDPACVSACITGALHKTEEGPVVYREDKCIGCRYCMVACPFQIPAYEYHRSLAPKVMKCTFCFQSSTGEIDNIPACAQVCPMEVMTFGKRSELIELARWKIRSHPGKYNEHIFGEYEVGGTSWLYLASHSFDTLGFPKLGPKAPPRLTEAIQSGLFQGFIPPLALFALLGGFMWLTKRKGDNGHNIKVAT